MPITTPSTGLIDTDRLIDNLDQAVKNIRRYQIEMKAGSKSAKELIRRMRLVRHWYAIESNGEWLFAPSKFIGYANNTADDYLNGNSRGRDGRETEKTLAQWFEIAQGVQETVLRSNLRRFLEGYGHSRENERAAIHILKPAYR